MSLREVAPVTRKERLLRALKALEDAQRELRSLERDSANELFADSVIGIGVELKKIDSLLDLLD